jgi:hypothetical protein
MAMDDEIFRRAVKKFYDGANFDEYEKATGKPMKYNHKFFDDMGKTARRKLGAAKRYANKEIPAEEDGEI